MLDFLIVAVLAGFLGIFVFDFFTKKKTEVNGAHVVVRFSRGLSAATHIAGSFAPTLAS